jgi:hypothetical protein
MLVRVRGQMLPTLHFSAVTINANAAFSALALNSFGGPAQPACGRNGRPLPGLGDATAAASKANSALQ